MYTWLSFTFYYDVFDEYFDIKCFFKIILMCKLWRLKVQLPHRASDYNLRYRTGIFSRRVGISPVIRSHLLIWIGRTIVIVLVPYFVIGIVVSLDLGLYSEWSNTVDVTVYSYSYTVRFTSIVLLWLKNNCTYRSVQDSSHFAFRCDVIDLMWLFFCSLAVWNFLQIVS